MLRASLAPMRAASRALLQPQTLSAQWCASAVAQPALPSTTAAASFSFRSMHSLSSRSSILRRSLRSSFQPRCFSATTPPPPPSASTPAAAPASDEVTMVMYGDGFSRTVTGRPGETLLDVAQNNEVNEIEGACEGCMCCSTCHLIFDQDTFDQLGPVPDDEQDVIDRAPGACDTSRLGCQVRVSKKLQDAKIRVPSEFVNQMI